MSRSTRERLYNLLPAIYRIRDAGQDEALRALMAVLESELVRIEEDIEGLYDDGFIETCAEWVVPYIGDLLGVRNLHPVESAAVFSKRAYVANTLGYRRRKGTTPVLEQLARDVTGWPSRAVEFFERLITTQHVNHLRLHGVATPDLRDGTGLELLGGPFERAGHTVEVRRIAGNRGKYNIPNIGLFLWRLQSYFILHGRPRLAGEQGSGRYTFSPLGNDIPLFNRPRTETGITHPAGEINVPGRLRRRPLFDELEALRQAMADKRARPPGVNFGINPVLQLLIKGKGDKWEAIPSEEMLICDLSGLPAGEGWRRPSAGKAYNTLDTTVDPPLPLKVELPIQVAVDPVLGRLAFPEGAVPDSMAVNYAYGFSGDIGGGPYSRRQTLVKASSRKTWTATVDQHDPKADYTGLAAALSGWGASSSQDAIITITDNGVYAETFAITMTGKQTLVLQAADEKRPTLRLFNGPADLAITGGKGESASLTFNGLWIEGGIRVDAQSLGMFKLIHCTLVPGRGLDINSNPRQPHQPSFAAGLPNADLQVEISHSIVGPLRLPDEITGLTVQDSIIHSSQHSPEEKRPAIAGDEAGKQPGPKTSLSRVTIFGTAYVRELALASESIFTGRVTAQRRQAGCTRFSFVPEDSQVPRRYRCQPDLALKEYARKAGKSSVDDLTDSQRTAVVAGLTPTFMSERYGDPACAQLRRSCAEEIRTGAEDGSEMGVFNHLKQPQREANLRAALDEYLRFGLEAGIVYVT